jgi:KipI family sensor histidine kinase inhibitor
LYYPRFLPLGDTALSVEFGDSISPELNQAVVDLDLAVRAANLESITETAPSYRSLLVCYEPALMSFDALVAALRGLMSIAKQTGSAPAAEWSVPVLYEKPFADDLEDVARQLGVSEEAVINLHSAADYRVYMLGFAPGWPYLGGLPDALHTSRKETPRAQVPVGAIVIGGVQAGIVPITTPSGWHIIGQTPLRPFNPDAKKPFLFNAGDRVRFCRIDQTTFDYLSDMSPEALLEMARKQR